MKRDNLRIGDVVVQRDGALGFCFEIGGTVYILYQDGGYDDVELSLDEDMTDTVSGSDADIMQVYREEGGFLTFSDYVEGELIFERQKDWKRPTKEEREQIKKERQAALEAKEAEWRRKAAENSVQLIHVIAQAFYGNRTATETTPDGLDALVLGCPSENSLIKKERIDRSIIPVPGTDHVVLVYNKYEEERALADREHSAIKPLATIPELGVKLYSRCVACRINEDGEPQSLQQTDYDALWKYLAN